MERRKRINKFTSGFVSVLGLLHGGIFLLTKILLSRLTISSRAKFSVFHLNKQSGRRETTCETEETKKRVEEREQRVVTSNKESRRMEKGEPLPLADAASDPFLVSGGCSIQRLCFSPTPPLPTSNFHTIRELPAARKRDPRAAFPQPSAFEIAAR